MNSRERFILFSAIFMYIQFTNGQIYDKIIVAEYIR